MMSKKSANMRRNWFCWDQEEKKYLYSKKKKEKHNIYTRAEHLENFQIAFVTAT